MLANFKSWSKAWPKTWVAVFAILVLSVSVIMPHLSHAQSAEPQPPEALQGLLQGGGALRYMGRDQGVDGWVTIKNGQEQYFYVTPGGQAIISGILYNPEGEVVTKRQIEQMRQRAGIETTPSVTTSATAKKPASRSELLMQAVEATNWFKLGDDAAPVVYSFIDPQCQHCHEFLKQIRTDKLIEDGKIQLRLIPVGIVNKDSIGQAAALLEDADAAKRLYDAVDGKENAILVPEGINTQAVQKNLATMQAWKMTATPFTVFRGGDGQVKIVRGAPNSIKSLVDQLP